MADVVGKGSMLESPFCFDDMYAKPTPSLCDSCKNASFHHGTGTFPMGSAGLSGHKSYGQRYCHVPPSPDRPHEGRCLHDHGYVECSSYELKPGMVNMFVWGKDHWSMLAYCEIRAVDFGGELKLDRIRINEFKRPFSNGASSALMKDQHKNYPYGTRMRDGSVPDPQHDDLDVLADLEKAGFIKCVGTDINPVIQMTPKGQKVVALLRQFKSTGGRFNDFQY